ncbi:MAG: formate--tetrahydrofolate ligase [Capnocytophaga leadbetteri]
MKERIGEIVFAYNRKGEMLKVKQLNIQGAVAALLKDAIKPMPTHKARMNDGTRTAS